MTLENKEHAGFGIRFVARMLDEIIITVIPLIILYALFGVTESVLFIFAVLLWLAIPGNFYYIYFHHKTGQTIGKKTFGLKAIKTDGARLSWGDAFIRWLGYRIGAMIFYLGQIWIALDDQKQGWHDKIANTCVVKVKK